MFLNIIASLAEYERELIRERTKPDLQPARYRGRPKGFSKEAISKLLLMRSVYQDLSKSPDKIYTVFGLTRATFYRYIKILDTHTHTDEEIRKMTVGK